MEGIRHICEFVIDDHALTRLLRHGTTTHCVVGIPDAAVCIGSYIEERTRQFVIRLEHPSFRSAIPGNAIHREQVVFEMKSAIETLLTQIAVDYPITLEDVQAIHRITDDINVTRRAAQYTQRGWHVHDILHNLVEEWMPGMGDIGNENQ